jgi:hypothetical protein
MGDLYDSTISWIFKLVATVIVPFLVISNIVGKTGNSEE